MLTAFFKNECGATAIEYSIIAALIALVLVVAIGNIGSTLNGTFTTIATTL